MDAHNTFLTGNPVPEPMQPMPHDDLKDFALRVVSESGNKAPWDVDGWLTTWLEQPVPALGGVRPSELLQTEGGLEQLLRLLKCARSGVFL